MKLLQVRLQEPLLEDRSIARTGVFTESVFRKEQQACLHVPLQPH